MLKSNFSFYTSREAANKLGVSITTIQLWVESGALPAWKTAGGHRRIPSEAVETILAKQQSTAVQGRGAHAHSVVIVEDEPVQREMYRIKFSEWDLPVNFYLAQDGFEGLLMIGKHVPDLVISDLSMPGMDGFEMIKRLIESKEIRVPALIVVTALNAREIEASGGLPEGIPVYSKPLSLGVLKPIVEKTIQHNRH
ncbi:response regulator [Thiobacillus sp.]|uniref:response regulator n=1 Tax=Thiobacillus sp. TaxID=924 RepID=UPI00286DB394|nr:response regulator [Thiobacillus sp.]